MPRINVCKLLLLIENKKALLIYFSVVHILQKQRFVNLLSRLNEGLFVGVEIRNTSREKGKSKLFFF
jgi:hypothetical protein